MRLLPFQRKLEKRPLMRFTLIGFGELGGALADRVGHAGVADLRIFTRPPRDEAAKRSLDARAAATGGVRVPTLEAAVAGADVVVAAVPASAAVKIASDCGPYLERSALYVDPTPLLPEAKQECAVLLAERGAAYVDAAVVGTVAADGYRVPILACGPGARRWQDAATELGLNVSVIDAPPGGASLVKLLRSVYMKGRDALILEMLVAASRYGVEDAVVESVNGSGEVVPFPALAERVMCALAVHAERRAEELESSAAVLEEVDVAPLVTRAGADRLRWLAELGLRDHFHGRRPDDLHDVLRAIEQPDLKPYAGGAPRPATVINIERSIEPLYEEWDALADRVGATPFLRPGWFAAWWRAFGDGELELLVARRDDRLCGVFPLYRHGSKLRSASNWHTPVFGVLAEDDETRSSLVRELFAHHPRRATLAFLEPQAREPAECDEAAKAAGYRFLTRTLERSPYVTIEGDWETFLRHHGRSVRSDLPRRLRRLQDEGCVTFDLSDGTDRLDELLEEGFAVESSGWKAAENSAILSKPETHAFYTEVARWAVERGWLKLMFLRLDGRPLAFQYNLVHNGVWYYIKGGYDPAYSHFSPGRLLTRAALEHAFSLGLSTYEFLGGDELYKLQWTSACHERTLFQAFAPSPMGMVDWCTHAYLRPLAKRIGLQPIALYLCR
jgi:CelD/BcsL family acetyltransferase involved in cellulose biosynthesis/3-hydroxyisobutyrate dehydrogenase-like beta-hydroxyacid dehydrogenase